MARILVTKTRWSTVALLAMSVLMPGCQASSSPRPPTGGDSPVTAQRLSESRLTDIHEPLSWRFDNSVVIIDYEGQPIPMDLVELLLAEQTTPVRIEASWRLDEAAGTLHLSDLRVDEESIDREVTIAIAPAGHVRVNLGFRQYNVFRDGAKDLLQ